MTATPAVLAMCRICVGTLSSSRAFRNIGGPLQFRRRASQFRQTGHRLIRVTTIGGRSIRFRAIADRAVKGAACPVLLILATHTETTPAFEQSFARAVRCSKDERRDGQRTKDGSHRAGCNAAFV